MTAGKILDRVEKVLDEVIYYLEKNLNLKLSLTDLYIESERKDPLKEKVHFSLKFPDEHNTPFNCEPEYFFEAKEAAKLPWVKGMESKLGYNINSLPEDKYITVCVACWIYNYAKVFKHLS